MNRLLFSSDPLISSIRPKPKKRSTPHSEEAIQMLISAEAHRAEDEETAAEESDSEMQGFNTDEETWDS